MSQHSGIYTTQEPCWRCQHLLYRVHPPIQGWSYYCNACAHLTQTKAALEQAMRDKDPEALGIVAAWPHKLNIEWKKDTQ